MNNFVLLITSFVIFTTACSEPEKPARPVPDTGQTRSYTQMFGDDGDYRILPASYTKLDKTGKELPEGAVEWAMVRDNVTGLIWEVKTDSGIGDKERRFTWYNPTGAANGGHAGRPGDGTDTQDFIDALNAERFGGFSAWRIPSVKELSTLINSGSQNPAIHEKYFVHTMPGNYWTSTADVTNRNYAWLVNFETGLVPYGFNKTDSYYVRAVYGSAGGFSPNLVEKGDGTVLDKTTGLMWQQATVEADRWEGAIARCEDLVLAGRDDWRLPNRNELQSLIDYDKHDLSISESIFPDTLPVYYWTSTTYTPAPSRSWVVSFQSGYVHFSNKSRKHTFRAVRGPDL